MIAQIGEHYYLIGVSEQNMQLICELPDFVPDTESQQRSALSFGQVFSEMLHRRGKDEKGDDGDNR